jgi:hypothetical protein
VIYRARISALPPFLSVKVSCSEMRCVYVWALSYNFRIAYKKAGQNVGMLSRNSQRVVEQSVIKPAEQSVFCLQ